MALCEKHIKMKGVVHSESNLFKSISSASSQIQPQIQFILLTVSVNYYSFFFGGGGGGGDKLTLGEFRLK